MSEQTEKDMGRAELESLIQENKALKRQILGGMIAQRFEQDYGINSPSVNGTIALELEKNVRFEDGELKFVENVGDSGLRYRSSLEDAIKGAVLRHGQAFDPIVPGSKKQDTHTYKGVDYQILKNDADAAKFAAATIPGGKHTIKRSELGSSPRQWCNRNEIPWKDFTGMIAKGDIKVIPD
jgi:hypothetical protein